MQPKPPAPAVLHAHTEGSRRSELTDSRAWKKEPGMQDSTSSGSSTLNVPDCRVGTYHPWQSVACKGFWATS